MRKVLYFTLLLMFIFIFSGCNDSINNEINNKVYDVDINIDDVTDLFVPAAEKASESVLGISIYARLSLLDSWKVSSIGSCVVYNTVAVLESGEKILYDVFIQDASQYNVEYFEYKVLTNAHVIESKSIFNKKVIYDGNNNINTEFKVLGKDDDIDLAVLYFESSILYAPMTFADNDSVKKGQFVLAVGNPVGFEYYSTATLGVISFPNRLVYEDENCYEYIQHDAAINPGNSGGALVNVNGDLVGINSSKVIEEGVDEIGFAIPISVIRKLLPRLESGEKIKKIKSGLNGSDIGTYKLNKILNSEEIEDKIKNLEYGYYVESISKNSVFLNQLQKGDIILEINDIKILTASIFDNHLIFLEKNDIIKLKILRGNNVEEIEIKY